VTFTLIVTVMHFVITFNKVLCTGTYVYKHKLIFIV